MTSPAAIARMKRHREELEYALAHGLSLKAARDRMAQERWHARQRAIAALGAVTPDAPLAPPEADRPAYWWQRD